MIDYHIVLVSLAALVAGFVDAVVGGGGLVQVPALFVLFPHFSVARVIGTNRFASFVGTSVAAYQYSKKVEIPWKTVFFAGVGAAVLSFLGATVSSLMRQEILKLVILILMIGIAGYTYFNKNLGYEEDFRVKMAQIPVYGLLIGMVTGFYNGFVGPGTGSLLVFGFVSIIGYSFLSGSAIAKFINVIADISSLIFFIYNGYVSFEIALPMMVCNITGSYLGSKMAILRGNSFVRLFFLMVVFGLIIRFGYDMAKEFRIWE